MNQILFPNNDTIFQDDNSLIHTAISVQSRFEENEDALHHLLWPAQLPDLNIIKPLWPALESRVRIRFPPPSSIKQLEDIFLEEWYSIPLEIIENLHESFPRSIQAVLQAKEPNYVLIKKFVSFKAVSIILSIHCISKS
jgi:hypothetical protein